MSGPTEEQLRDPDYWKIVAPEWATSFGFAGISRCPVWFNLRQYAPWNNKNKVIQLGAKHCFGLGDIDRAASRPSKPTEPDRTSPEWDDWKIPPGSFAYWMLERMNRETGRMSYDNPVKGMIRDLWSVVDRPTIPDPNEREDEPDAYMCPAGCGCLWRDNGDDTMSLYGPKSQSCDACELLPLNRLVPVKKLRTQAEREKDEIEKQAMAIAMKAVGHESGLIPVTNILRDLYDAGMLIKGPES